MTEIEVTTQEALEIMENWGRSDDVLREVGYSKGPWVIQAAIAAIRARAEQENPEPLTREMLTEMQRRWVRSQAKERQWVWVKVIDPERVSLMHEGYWSISADYSQGESFCVSTQGVGMHFDWCDKGKTWEAYAHKPGEVAG